MLIARTSSSLLLEKRWNTNNFCSICTARSKWMSRDVMSASIKRTEKGQHWQLCCRQTVKPPEMTPRHLCHYSWLLTTSLWHKVWLDTDRCVCISGPLRSHQDPISVSWKSEKRAILKEYWSKWSINTAQHQWCQTDNARWWPTTEQNIDIAIVTNGTAACEELDTNSPILSLRWVGLFPEFPN